MIVQLPPGGVESIAQRRVHVLFPQHAIHHELLSRDGKLDVHVELLALLLTLVRQSDGHPATTELGMKALELGHLVADMRLDRVGMLDAVEYDLDRFDHRPISVSMRSATLQSRIRLHVSAMRQTRLDARQPPATRRNRAGIAAWQP